MISELIEAFVSADDPKRLCADPVYCERAFRRALGSWPMHEDAAVAPCLCSICEDLRAKGEKP